MRTERTDVTVGRQVVFAIVCAYTVPYLTVTDISSIHPLHPLRHCPSLISRHGGASLFSCKEKKGGGRRDIIVEMVNRLDENGITVCYGVHKNGNGQMHDAARRLHELAPCRIFVSQHRLLESVYCNTDHPDFMLFHSSAVLIFGGLFLTKMVTDLRKPQAASRKYHGIWPRRLPARPLGSMSYLSVHPSCTSSLRKCRTARRNKIVQFTTPRGYRCDSYKRFSEPFFKFPLLIPYCPRF